MKSYNISALVKEGRNSLICMLYFSDRFNLYTFTFGPMSTEFHHSKAEETKMGSFSKLWKETDLGLARSVRKNNLEKVDHQKWTSKVPACALTPESPGSSAADD